MFDLLLRILIFGFGLWLSGYTILSALRTFVLPRGEPTLITGLVFSAVRRLTEILLNIRKHPTYEMRDRALALLSPISLFILPMVWLTLITFGYTGMYWSLSSAVGWREAFLLSGSSLMTLGFQYNDEMPLIILAFSEAALSMMLIALLIGYLPTMYSAFSRRESAVNRLEVRAGSPPSAVEMIIRLHRIGMLYDHAQMENLWSDWELWFVEIEESHTTLAALNFFRSPKPQNSWITTSGTIMDCAALIASSVDVPRNFRAELSIRAGFIALRSICDFFGFPYNANPKPDDPISIAREEFDNAYDQLAAEQIPMKKDREQAWRDYAGWRVNYDTPLLNLANLLYAPYAPWVSDRSNPMR